ncbi:MAG: YtxH domain-containing protein [Mangrovibacterium sp.]
MSTNKVILGALAGLAAGAVLGILLAPDKGSETRRKIVDKGGETLEDLKDTVDDLVGSLQGQVDNLKSKLQEAQKSFQQKVQDAGNTVEEAEVVEEAPVEAKA